MKKKVKITQVVSSTAAAAVKAAQAMEIIGDVAIDLSLAARLNSAMYLAEARAEFNAECQTLGLNPDEVLNRS